jgi:EmrB/QacA subfamily drug resistance transporter
MTATETRPGGRHAAREESGHRHLGVALTLICIAQLMVVLDATIANIALPYIQRDLSFSQDSLSWIVTAYSLTFGGFLLLGGRTGDLFGRRRAFMFGLIVFALASLVGGFAQSEQMLLASRAAQGFGAAFASPNALALITTTFEPGPKRSRAFAVYAMMSGIGAAVGLLLGGWLTGSDMTIFGTDVHGWRFTFFINVPIGLIAAAIAPWVLRESDTHAGKLDVPGAATATAGLLSLVYGITRGGTPTHGWSDGLTITALALGVVLLVVFALIESRHRQPLLPFRILKNRDRLSAYITMMLIPASMFTMFFFLSQVLQNVMGESPMRTGLMFLPFSVTMVIAATIVSKLVQKVNPGYLAAAGATIGAIAVFGFSRMPYDATLPHLGADIGYVSHILPFIVLMPIGMSLVFIPTTMSVLHAVSNRDSGIASGVLNTMQQVGGALGVATLGTIAYHATTNKITELCGELGASGVKCDPRLGSHLYAATFTHGASTAFFWCSAMLLVGALVSLFFNRIRHEDLASGNSASEPAVAAH